MRKIPSHGVAALSAFGIKEGNTFRDCIDSLLIDLEGKFLLMINKVIKRMPMPFNWELGLGQKLSWELGCGP